MAVRPAKSGDALGIARIEVESWRSSYAGLLPDSFLVGMSVARRQAGWAALLRSETGSWVWQEAPNRLLGFGCCGPERGSCDGYDGEITMLYVLPDAQGRGIGRDLLTAMLGSLRDQDRRSVLVWVLRNNPARFFYQAMGARLVLERQMKFAGKYLDMSGYGWTDTATLLDRDMASRRLRR